MGLSKSRKCYLAGLAIVVTAFLAYRLFLGAEDRGPAAAQASPAAPAAPKAAPPPVSAEKPQGLSASSLAERLAALAKSEDLDPARMRDAFVLPEAWRRELAPPAPSPSLPAGTETFIQEHKLTSVVLTGDGGSAIVNGKFLRLGHALDGYRLLHLTQSQAVFESVEGNNQVVLPLEKTGSQGGF